VCVIIYMYISIVVCEFGVRVCVVHLHVLLKYVLKPTLYLWKISDYEDGGEYLAK
jgi:hypothetical protein